MSQRLFPTELPDRSWVEFESEGYSALVSGVICRASSKPVCGMPLGGIDTGCVDLEANGTFGYCTVFNSHVPRRGPMNMPFLGISLDSPHFNLGRYAWVLTTMDMQGVELSMCQVDMNSQSHWRLKRPKEISYWGHYPLVDMEYELDAPVSVGVRAWSPFIPGDSAASNTPGTVFEVHLRNTSGAPQKGTVAFSFPGPSPQESGGDPRFIHERLDDEVVGVHVSNGPNEYVLGAIAPGSAIRIGGDLGLDSGAWARITDELPLIMNQAGASIAADFELKNGEEKIIRFILTWYSPQWRGGGNPTAGGGTYTHMYSTRYSDAVDVANMLVANHESLLRRILAWQEVIYRDDILPVWLKDSLINILYLIPELSFWAVAELPIEDWCKPKDGLFGMSDDPKSCPQLGHIGCSWYSGLPIAYFFPELLLSLLRAHKEYQYSDGAMAWALSTRRPPCCEMVDPHFSPRPTYQDSMNGLPYTAMVDWYSRITHDDSFLAEFYPSLKKNTLFTMNLARDAGPGAQVISMPLSGGNDWFECVDMYGMVTHVGGVHLAQIEIVKRIAEEVGDGEFAKQCGIWLEEGGKLLEERLWGGEYYLLYSYSQTGDTVLQKPQRCTAEGWVEVENLPQPGTECDVIMGYQLDGEYIARLHGLPGVFLPDRVGKTLSTIRSVATSPRGVLVFSEKPGGKTKLQRNLSPTYKPKENEVSTGYWTNYGVHPPASFAAAATYMYHGEKEWGLEVARRTMHGLVCENGWAWHLPNCFAGDSMEKVGHLISDRSAFRYDGDDEERLNGFDYGQNLMLWSLPAALVGGDFATPLAPGGLVDRIIRAGRTGSAVSHR